MRILRGHEGTITSVAVSSDRQILASGSKDKTIRVWDLYTGELLQTLIGHGASVSSITMSSDGQILASGSEDKTVRVWKSQ